MRDRITDAVARLDDELRQLAAQSLPIRAEDIEGAHLVSDEITADLYTDNLVGDAIPTVVLHFWVEPEDHRIKRNSVMFTPWVEWLTVPVYSMGTFANQAMNIVPEEDGGYSLHIFKTTLSSVVRFKLHATGIIKGDLRYEWIKR